MSTELNRCGRLNLTQFYGGERRGVCLHVRDPREPTSTGVDLTVNDARALAARLTAWADTCDARGCDPGPSRPDTEAGEDDDDWSVVLPRRRGTVAL